MDSLRPAWGTRLFFAAMAIFFAYAIAVQLNDVDGPVWIAVYLAPAAIALVLAIGAPALLLRGVSYAALAVAAVAIPWALSLAPEAAKVPSFAESEVAREVGGLVIVSLFCLGVFGWMRWRTQRASRHTGERA